MRRALAGRTSAEITTTFVEAKTPQDYLDDVLSEMEYKLEHYEDPFL